MILSLLLAVAPVVTPVSSSALRDGGTAVVVRVQTSGYEATLTGRARVSNSHGLSDIINTYGLDSEIWGMRGDGGVVSMPNEPSIELTAPTDGGTQAIETHQKFRYSAGYPQQILQTAAIVTAADAGTYRWGYFDDGDGLFWEVEGGSLSFVRRTSTSGAPVEYRTAVPGSYALTSGNVYEIRFLWLGYFQVDGFVNGAKVFSQNFAGLGASPYLKTAYLPVRAEVKGVGAKLKYVCTSVQTEGGDDPPGFGYAAVRPTDKSIGVGAGILPIIAIRPALTLQGQPSRVQSVPSSLSCFADGKRIRVYVIMNPTTLTGASWAAYNGSSMEVDVAATAYTGGEAVCISGVADNGQTETQLEHVFSLTQRTLKVRAFGASRDTLLVAADALLGTTLVSCAIEWREYR